MRTNATKCERLWKASHTTNEARTLLILEVSNHLDLSSDATVQEDHEKHRLCAFFFFKK